jgi:hypothetical protein
MLESAGTYPPWAGIVYQNNKKLTANKKRRRMVTLTTREQYEAGLFSRHETAGWNFDRRAVSRDGG